MHCHTIHLLYYTITAITVAVLCATFRWLRFFDSVCHVFWRRECVEPILTHLYYTSTMLHQKKLLHPGLDKVLSKVLPRYQTLHGEKKVAVSLTPARDRRASHVQRTLCALQRRWPKFCRLLKNQLIDDIGTEAKRVKTSQQKYSNKVQEAIKIRPSRQAQKGVFFRSTDKVSLCWGAGHF